MTNARAGFVQQTRRILASRLMMLLAVCLLAWPLAGCSTSGFAGGPSDTTSIATATSVAPPPSRAKLAFAPIVGAPAAVGDMLSGAVTSAVSKQGIPIASGPTDTPDYTVRGYLVAAPDKAGTKISYIWDITAKTGERAKRITGEQIVAGKKVKDPWSVVDQSVVDKIAAATSGELSTWVPMKGGAAMTPPGTPSASAAPAETKSSSSSTSSFGSTIGSIFGFGGADTASAAPVPDAATTAPMAKTASLGTPANGPLIAGSSSTVTATAAPPATTGSLTPSGAQTTAIPAVTGAPGDGATALTSAIQRSLSGSGVQLAQAGGSGSYVVQGHVTMGAPVAGKQTIKIEWVVFDPAGKKVGTVSQNNSVPQGSLDGTWGKTADMAAQAAAAGILKLLPHGQNAG